MSDPIREAIERAALLVAMEANERERDGFPVYEYLINDIITAELAPLFEARDARVRKLEDLLLEARNDLHYAIRVATSDSSTDVGFTKYARRLFASEIETIEKIDQALAARMAAQRGDEE